MLAEASAFSRRCYMPSASTVESQCDLSVEQIERLFTM